MGAASGGKVLVMGGFVSPQLEVTSRVDVYDPDTDTWAPAPPLPGAQTHGAAAEWGDQVVIAGGFVGPGGSWTTTAQVWSRQADGSWAAGPSLPHPRAAAAAATIGGRLHVVGGLAADGTSDTDEHVAGDLSAPFETLPPLPNARNHLGAASLGSTLLVVGGRHGWDEANGDQADLDLYDDATRAWRAGAPVPQAASEIAGATFPARGRLVVVGGSIAGVHPTAKVWSYDSGTNAWTALPDLPAPRKGAVAVAVGNRIVVTTGSPTSVDPAAETWVGCCL